MTLAWALDLAADSRLWTCLPPCHVNVAACGPCPWVRTLLKLVGLAACGPGLGLVRLADGPTMGLWTWLLVGLASLCGSNCGPSCYCYLWTCLAPAAVTSHCKQAAREIVDFHMWTRQSVNLACCQPTWQELEICLSCLLDGPARLPTCVPGCLRTLPSGTQLCGPTAWIQFLVGPPYGADSLRKWLVILHGAAPMKGATPAWEHISWRMRAQLVDHCNRPLGLSNITPCGLSLAYERAFVVADRPVGLHQPSARTHSLWIGAPTPSNTLWSCPPWRKSDCQPWKVFGPEVCGPALCIYLLGLACAPSCSSFLMNVNQGVQRDSV